MTPQSYRERQRVADRILDIIEDDDELDAKIVFMHREGGKVSLEVDGNSALALIEVGGILYEVILLEQGKMKR